MITGSVLQEELQSLMCMCLTTQHILFKRQRLMELPGIKHRYTTIVGDFNPSIRNGHIQQAEKISPQLNLTKPSNHQSTDTTDIQYRLLLPTTAEYIFFSSSHGTFIKIYLILEHKNTLVNLTSKSKKQKQIPVIGMGHRRL